MRVLSERWSARILPVLITLAMGDCCAVLSPIEDDATPGIRKLALFSYYEREPLTVQPGAPSYSLPIRFTNISNSWIFALDDNAKEAIERNGFVVMELGIPMDDMVALYEDLPEAGIPTFVTSDSLLHLYHVQFGEILRFVEENEFSLSLISMTNALVEESVRQYDSFSGDLREAARRNAAYFSVALRLLGSTSDPPSFVAEQVSGELAKIEAHAGFAESDIFAYLEDYSQYVPRGHYTRSETLKRYFKMMMWYGRMSFLLKGSESWGPMGEALVSVEDAKIQTLQASLIALALDSLEDDGKPIADLWNKIYAVTAFFVGLADDLTPYDYKESLLKVFDSPVNVEDFNDADRVFTLKTELALLPSPQIYGGTGNCAMDPPITPEKLDEILEKTKGMRLMGQRFIPDSYMLQHLVLPAVGAFTGSGGDPFTMGTTGGGRMRCFPRGLDVMAVLGCDEALAILEKEGDTDYVGYDEALEELIVLFDSFKEEDWNRNLYWSWLYTLKGLLGNYGQGYPAFMQGIAWQDKELNAALASWAELRHDTILYAKQSYTGVVTSVPPRPDRGYVEPVPEFYARLLALTRMTRRGLDDMGVLNETQRGRLTGLENVLSRLLSISISELEGGELSEADSMYIERFGDALKPLVEDLSDEKGAKTTLVADVHTDANSSSVLEEGVGYVKMIVAAYMLPDGRIVLGAGPVFSYYEFKWPMDDRLTDEKWTQMLESGDHPAPPDWVRSFTHPVVFPPEEVVDADGDQLPDDWERSVWGSIEEVNDPSGDCDGDGFSNRQEYLAGTDPRDAQSFFRAVGIVPWSSGTFVRWKSAPGKRYQVSCSEDLVTWRPFGAPITAGQDFTDIFDDATSPIPRRFYRINAVR